MLSSLQRSAAHTAAIGNVSGEKLGDDANKCKICTWTKRLSNVFSYVF